MLRVLPEHGYPATEAESERALISSAIVAVVGERGYGQTDLDLVLARAGVDHGQLVGQQPQHRDLDGGIGTGNADAISAFTHASTPGARTPGCSKNTCTSSHSRW